MDYFLSVAVIICIYAILALSLDMQIGWGGLLSLAHACYFGTGAYACAVLTTTYGWAFFPALIVGSLGTGAVGALVAIGGGHMRDDYFSIFTLSIQVVFLSLINNLDSVTGGPLGVKLLSTPSIGYWLLKSKWDFLVLTSMLLLITVLVVWRLYDSPYGRIVRATREDTVYVASLGYSVVCVKVVAVSLSACFAGLAGSVFAQFTRFIDPSSFTIVESVLIAAMVLIGGAGRVFGVVLGATLLILLPELLRFAGMPSAVAAQVRQMIFGLSLVVTMLIMPGGMLDGQKLVEKRTEV